MRRQPVQRKCRRRCAGSGKGSEQFQKRAGFSIQFCPVAALIDGLLQFGLCDFQELSPIQLDALWNLRRNQFSDEAGSYTGGIIEQVRVEVARFQAFADETRYFAATSDRLDQSTPYYNPGLLDQAADMALTISENWGDRLQQLPLESSRISVRQTVLSLLLVTVHSRVNFSDTHRACRPLDDLLDRAEAMGAIAICADASRSDSRRVSARP